MRAYKEVMNIALSRTFMIQYSELKKGQEMNFWSGEGRTSHLTNCVVASKFLDDHAQHPSMSVGNTGGQRLINKVVLIAGHPHW